MAIFHTACPETYFRVDGEISGQSKMHFFWFENAVVDGTSRSPGNELQTAKVHNMRQNQAPTYVLLSIQSYLYQHGMCDLFFIQYLSVQAMGEHEVACLTIE